MAKQDKPAIRRMSEVMPVEMQKPVFHKPDEYQGIDLLLRDFEVTKGQYGEYYTLICEVAETGERVEIGTGSMAVRRCVESIKSKRELPILFQFQLDGKTWLMI